MGISHRRRESLQHRKIDQFGNKLGVDSLLNEFGVLVESAIESRKKERAKQLSNAEKELAQVVEVAKKEVDMFERGLCCNYKLQIREVTVKKDGMTYLPSIWLSLNHLPTLVIEIKRSYVQDGRGAVIGIRAQEYCGGRLYGRVAQAANYVQSRLSDSNYSKSILEVLNLWATTNLEIPLSSRLYCSKNRRKRPKLPKRRIVKQKYAKVDEEAERSSKNEKKWTKEESTVGSEELKIFRCPEIGEEGEVIENRNCILPNRRRENVVPEPASLQTCQGKSKKRSSIDIISTIEKGHAKKKNRRSRFGDKVKVATCT